MRLHRESNQEEYRRQSEAMDVQTLIARELHNANVAAKVADIRRQMSETSVNSVHLMQALREKLEDLKFKGL